MSETLRNRNMAMFYAAVVLAAAPIAVAVLRATRTGGDTRYFWVALAAFVGVLLVMLAGRARGHSRKVIMRLAWIGFLVSTLLGILAARLVGARAMPGVILVALVIALFYTASAVLYLLSRSPQG